MSLPRYPLNPRHPVTLRVPRTTRETRRDPYDWFEGPGGDRRGALQVPPEPPVSLFAAFPAMWFLLKCLFTRSSNAQPPTQ